jgi:hypothetical protein
MVAVDHSNQTHSHHVPRSDEERDKDGDHAAHDKAAVAGRVNEDRLLGLQLKGAVEAVCVALKKHGKIIVMQVVCLPCNWQCMGAAQV